MFWSSAAFKGAVVVSGSMLQVLLFMHTFLYSAHDAARLMKANLEHDHYEAAPASSAHADPKQLWQGITVSSTLLPLPSTPPPPLPLYSTPPQKSQTVACAMSSWHTLS